MELVEAGWRSQREQVIDEAQSQEVVRLAELDARIGAAAHSRFGLGPDGSPSPGLPRRAVGWVVRRLRLRALLGAGRRVERRLRRAAWSSKHRLGAPTGTERVRIAPEPATADEGARLLAGVREPWIALVRPGGALDRTGIAAIEDAVAADPDAVLVYGDSRSPHGRRSPAPAFSQIRLREEDFLGPVVAISTRWLREIGGFQAEADGAQVLDLALRAGADRIRRLTSVVGVGRATDRPAGERESAAAEAVRRDLARGGRSARVTAHDGVRSVEYEVDGHPMVSIVIPTRGGSGEVAGTSRAFVVEAVRGIIERTTWPSYEVVVVADDVTPQEVVDALEEVAGDRLRLVRWAAPFNFSAKMNLGAVVARGTHLLLLNDDVELLTPDWLERMLGLVQQPGVGLVGAMLFFEDGSIQHLGHLYDRGAPGHVAFGVTPGAIADPAELGVVREVSGVTAACALISADLFREVGGFSPDFPGNYNDVDLSRKVVDRGQHILCSGAVRLYHFESRTRDARVLPGEYAAIQSRWGARLQRDEFTRTSR